MQREQSELEAVADRRSAAVLVKHPLRVDILRAAHEPTSASRIASELGLPRQKVNYHVRELARAGLLRRAGRRKRGNMYEQRYVATARQYVLSPEVRAEIESQQTPLGRILIQHDVLRKIHLMSLWQVQPGPDLCQILGLAAPQTTYGRAAVIDCNGEPAIELLEIVTPSES